jgi:hypothetical protein
MRKVKERDHTNLRVICDLLSMSRRGKIIAAVRRTFEERNALELRDVVFNVFAACTSFSLGLCACLALFHGIISRDGKVRHGGNERRAVQMNEPIGSWNEVNLQSPWSFRIERMFQCRVHKAEAMSGASSHIIGNTNFINLSAALLPQGSFSGLSKVFPKRTSSLDISVRKRPLT